MNKLDVFSRDPFFMFPESIFDEVFKVFSNRPGGFPVYDQFEEDDKIVLEFALAGYSADQLSVTAEGSKLTISASAAQDSGGNSGCCGNGKGNGPNHKRCKNPQYRGRRIAARAFTTSFTTNGLSLEDVEVSFVDGILRVEVPRIVPAKPEVKKFDIATEGAKALK